MTSENRILWERINAFAEVALKDIDPQKTQVSVQLDALRPVLEEIAAEKGVSLEDMFILYMDMASEAGVEAEAKFQEDMESNGNSFAGRAKPRQRQQPRGACRDFFAI